MISSDKKRSPMATPTVSRVGKTGLQNISLPRLSPEQQQLFSQVMGSAQPGITSGVGQLSQLAAGNQDKFSALEAPALRQFQDLAGGLGARFSGLGTGAQRSSGFQHALGGAASDLAERLQGQRLGLQNQAIQQLMGLYGSLMGTDQFENILAPKKKPWWQELLAGLGGVAGQGAGTLGGLYGASRLGLLG